ncbi:BET1 homolog [Montipora foliosa]|uniref:BET1 homolog n=1 Tax=Montipora foliosa TaxID=591990 RepID=UPI0035F1A2C2
MRRAHASDFQGQGNMAQRTDHNMLEEENERMVDHLSSKVQALKSLTIDIGQEVRYQNKMLGEMDTDFDAGGSLLSSTMGRLTALTKKGHHRVMLYLFLFCLFVFFVAWYIIKRR